MSQSFSFRLSDDSHDEPQLKPADQAKGACELTHLILQRHEADQELVEAAGKQLVQPDSYCGLISHSHQVVDQLVA